MMMELVSEGNGSVIDTISLSRGLVKYENGSARGIFESKKALYVTDAATFRALLGSSNGYLSFHLVSSRVGSR